MSAFRFLPAAAADLEEIYEFVALDNPVAATRICAEIYAALSGQLSQFPYSGHRRDDLTRLQLRFWPVDRRLIVYAPDESPVLIVAILHGSRDPEELAAILDDRRR